jgi:hypothetical protein
MALEDSEDDENQGSPREISTYKGDTKDLDLRVNFCDLVLKSKHNLMSTGKNSDVAKDIVFNGFDNSTKINEEKNGFSIDDKEFIQMQHASRVTDVILFCHGQLSKSEKIKVFPSTEK